MQQLILDSSLVDIKTEAKDVDGANLRLKNPFLSARLDCAKKPYLNDCRGRNWHQATIPCY